jgi:hypothetical protein
MFFPSLQFHIPVPGHDGHMSWTVSSLWRRYTLVKTYMDKTAIGTERG